MRPTVTDRVAWSVGRSVRLSHYWSPWEMGREGAILRGKGRPIVKYRNTLRSIICAKTVEPIKMPFGLWPWIGPRNHVLDGVQIPHRKGWFCWKGALIVKYRDFLPWAVQKRLNRSRCRLGCWDGWTKEPRIQWGYRSHAQGQFWGWRACPIMPTTFWHELCKKGWTDRDAV